MSRRRRMGQSTAEYAIVIGLVIAAAVAMQVYVKRAIQGKVKGAVDYSPGSYFTTKQFEPDYAASTMTTTKLGTVTNETEAEGKVIRTIAQEGEVTKRSGTQQTMGLDKEGNIKPPAASN